NAAIPLFFGGRRQFKGGMRAKARGTAVRQRTNFGLLFSVIPAKAAIQANFYSQYRGLCGDRDARLPAERLQCRHVGEEALAAAIDENLTGKTVPEPIEREKSVIDLRGAAILLARRADEARHQLEALGERRAKPAHEAALAEHILETKPMSGGEK